MPIVLKVIIIVILVLIAAIAIGAYLLFRSADKKADKFRVVGVVVSWQQGKLPWFGRACIDYTKKGKHYQAMTWVMRKSKQPKIGAKLMWEIHAFHIPGKPIAYLAFRPKKESASTVPAATKNA